MSETGNPTWMMGIEEALPILMDMASRYMENHEEAFIERPNKDTTDAELEVLAEKDGEWDLDEYKEARDLWRAMDVAQKFLEHWNKDTFAKE